MLLKAFPDLSRMTVIDLGGKVTFWTSAGTRPAAVHIVNTEPQRAELPNWIRADVADACALPPAISATSYDLVLSNSVIEHVGGHRARLALAESVHKLSDRHWVQTPYRYFPIEPHFLVPGGQFLPVAWRANVVRRWPLTASPTSDHEAAMRKVLGIELLGRQEMRYYFPHSQLWSERWFGVPKSLIAVKTS